MTAFSALTEDSTVQSHGNREYYYVAELTLRGLYTQYMFSVSMSGSCNHVDVLETVTLLFIVDLYTPFHAVGFMVGYLQGLDT